LSNDRKEVVRQSSVCKQTPRKNDGGRQFAALVLPSHTGRAFLENERGQDRVKGLIARGRRSREADRGLPWRKGQELEVWGAEFG